MHATELFFAVIALLPLALAAPATRALPQGPLSRLPRPVNGRQEYTPPPITSKLETSPAPSCDVSGIQQPASALAPPTADMQLVLIALGQGTQNYTCADATSTPAAIGAVAQLFNASCALSNDPSVATASLGYIEETVAIGAHFFVDTTTPDFDILGLGNTQAKKVQDTPAPQPTSDVKWLRLQAQAQGTTSSVKEIYRLNTKGGLAPATCEGKAPGDVIMVDYEAQYWVYA